MYRSFWPKKKPEHTVLDNCCAKEGVLIGGREKGGVQERELESFGGGGTKNPKNPGQEDTEANKRSWVPENQKKKIGEILFSTGEKRVSQQKATISNEKPLQTMGAGKVQGHKLTTNCRETEKLGKAITTKKETCLKSNLARTPTKPPTKKKRGGGRVLKKEKTVELDRSSDWEAGGSPGCGRVGTPAEGGGGDKKEGGISDRRKNEWAKGRVLSQKISERILKKKKRGHRT